MLALVKKKKKSVQFPNPVLGILRFVKRSLSLHWQPELQFSQTEWERPCQNINNTSLQGWRCVSSCLGWQQTSPTSSLKRSHAQTRLSLVTMSTRTDWSKAEHTHRPCLSGLQSRLAIGWVDNVTFCNRLTVPATPMSTSSESFLLLWAGYSLERRLKQKLTWKSDYSRDVKPDCWEQPSWQVLTYHRVEFRFRTNTVHVFTWCVIKTHFERENSALTISINVGCPLHLQSWRCLCSEANASPARWLIYEPEITEDNDRWLPQWFINASRSWITQWNY